MRRVLGFLALAGLLWGCGDSTEPDSSGPPEIRELIVRPASTTRGGLVRATGVAVDPDGGGINVLWTAAHGTINSPNDFSTTWTAPDSGGVFTLVFTATNGTFSTSDSVQVGVGDAVLTVLSDPPGASISLDGLPLFEKTPLTLSALPPGLHTVTLSHPFFAFEDPTLEVELTDASVDTLRFRTAPATVQGLNTGRTDLLEVGGVVFLPGGFGYLFAARTPEGTGLFSSALNPIAENGRRLVTNVSLTEPITVSNDSLFVLYVDAEGSLISAKLTDINGDGLIESAGPFYSLNNSEQYGPAMGSGARLAFTVHPSTEDPVQRVFWAFFSDSTLSPWQIATSRNGRLPSWEPDGDRVVFEDRGILYTGSANTGSSALFAQREGWSFTAPAWSRWGASHIAMLGGSGEGLTDVLLGVRTSPDQASVLTGLTDPRFLSWSSVQRSLLVSHNPGSGIILLLSNFPFP